MNYETVAVRIHRKLTAAFTPTLLEIKDESAKHAGHSGSRPSGETHFHIRMISTALAGMPPVARHRAVYQVLSDEMQEGGIHALALDVSAAQANPAKTDAISSTIA